MIRFLSDGAIIFLITTVLLLFSQLHVESYDFIFTQRICCYCRSCPSSAFSSVFIVFVIVVVVVVIATVVLPLSFHLLSSFKECILLFCSPNILRQSNLKHVGKGYQRRVKSATFKYDGKINIIHKIIKSQKIPPRNLNFFNVSK